MKRTSVLLCTLMMTVSPLAYAAEDVPMSGQEIPVLEIAKTKPAEESATADTTGIAGMDTLMQQAMEKAFPGKTVMLERMQARDVASKKILTEKELSALEGVIQNTEVTPNTMRVVVTMVRPDARAVTLQGQFVEAREAPVLARSLAKGDMISTDDVMMQKVALRSIRRDAVLAPEALIGKQAKRSLEEGKLVSARDVMSEVVVAKGKDVRAYYRMPGMELQTLVTAQQDGARGDHIKVKNTQTGTIVQATVQEDGSVTVGENAPSIAKVEPPKPATAAQPDDILPAPSIPKPEAAAIPQDADSQQSAALKPAMKATEFHAGAKGDLGVQVEQILHTLPDNLPEHGVNTPITPVASEAPQTEESAPVSDEAPAVEDGGVSE